MAQSDGFKELDAQLRSLGSKTAAKVLKGAFRSAMLPAKKRAQATVPVGTEPHRLAATYGKRLVAPGFAKRSIKIKTFVRKDRPGIVTAILGVKKEAFYAVQFWEYGSIRHPKRPWLGKAFRETEAEVLDRLKKQMRRGIDRAIAKAGK